MVIFGPNQGYFGPLGHFDQNTGHFSANMAHFGEISVFWTTRSSFLGGLEAFELKISMMFSQIINPLTRS